MEETQGMGKSKPFRKPKTGRKPPTPLETSKDDPLSLHLEQLRGERWTLSLTASDAYIRAMSPPRSYDGYNGWG